MNVLLDLIRMLLKMLEALAKRSDAREFTTLMTLLVLALTVFTLAVGLDAMRQLAFVGSPFPVGTPPVEVEALILVAMSVGFTLAARYTLAALERMARREGRLSLRWQ